MNKQEKIQKDFEYCEQYMNLINQDFKSYSNTFEHYINNFCNQNEIKKIYEIIIEIYKTIYITYNFIDFKNNLLNIYDDYIKIVNIYIKTLKKQTNIDTEYDKLLHYYYIYDAYHRRGFIYNHMNLDNDDTVRLHYLLDMFLCLKNKNIISIEDFNNCLEMNHRMCISLFGSSLNYFKECRKLYYIEDKYKL
jgi:hypothetical protein